MEQAALFKSIFKRDIDDPGNKEFLEKVVLDHPYFTAAHFFLLKQLVPGTNEYKWQAAKTSILFNDPLWLNFQLNQGNGKHDTTAPVHLKDEEKQSEPVEEECLDEDQTGDPLPGLNIKFPSFHTDEKADTPVFEPQYTRDYFASQGIRLNEEAIPSDKLGKQLKSFTEWLKTMKKVHGDKIPDNNPGTDTNIQVLAEKSNREEEILTESMAEVFSKQGKNGKAIEVYQKLSLLNPSKSAYFAAKIEQIKTT